MGLPLAVRLWALAALTALAESPPPALSVSIHAPAAGSALSGTVMVDAEAAGAVAGIQLKLDGVDLGLRGVVSPHLVSWNTAEAADGPHTLSVVAWDALGTSTSSVVGVNVQNLAPQITSVGTGAIGATNATVVWLTQQPADSQVEYGLAPIYGASSMKDGVLVSTHTASLIGLTPGTLYHYRVKSRNAAGVQGLSYDLTFTTASSLAPLAGAAAGVVQAAAPRRFLTPTNGRAVFGPDAQEVAIFDIRGRRIFDASRGGGAALAWDSKDGAGRTVESGVYIARIKTASGTVYQSFAVVK